MLTRQPPEDARGHGILGQPLVSGDITPWFIGNMYKRIYRALSRLY